MKSAAAAAAYPVWKKGSQLELFEKVAEQECPEEEYYGQKVDVRYIFTRASLQMTAKPKQHAELGT